MARYTIDQVSKISGLSKLLIRTWENRYNLFQPDRTETNIRLYSDEDLVKVLNVQLLRERGLKISKISLFDNEMINDIVRSIPGGEEGFEMKQINRIIESGLTFNKALFTATMQECLPTYDIITLYKSIILPALDKLGYLFLSGDLQLSQEHFLSELIKQRIQAEIGLENELVQDDKKCWLLFLPEGEYHDIGLLIAHLILSQQNQRVVYLGQSVPIAALYILKDYCSIDSILFFAVTKNSMNRVSEITRELKTHFKNTKINYVASKNAIELDSEKNVQIISTLEQFQKLLSK
jgi:MerR family transcriptional regulator, light-induced transcriptional regulator